MTIDVNGYRKNDIRECTTGTWMITIRSGIRKVHLVRLQWCTTEERYSKNMKERDEIV